MVTFFQTGSGSSERETVQGGPVPTSQLATESPTQSSFHLNLRDAYSPSSVHSDSESSSSVPSPSHSSSSSVDSNIEASPETSDESDSTVSPEQLQYVSQQTTFKLVGDNIDKNVRPREMRSEHQTRSLHYFHAYAVRDRVDMSTFSNDAQLPVASAVNLQDLLPTSSDEVTMRENFVTLVGRTLTKYMPFFSELGKGLQRHIPHEFSHEMGQKSEVVGFTCVCQSDIVGIYTTVCYTKASSTNQITNVC